MERSNKRFFLFIKLGAIKFFWILIELHLWQLRSFFFLSFSYSLDDANIKVKQFIEESFAFGSEKLIIVTGKGIHSQNDKDPYTSQKLGILKYSVPDFLKNNLSLSALIKEIAPARIEDGGEGAFYIYLKKKIK